MLSQRVHRVSYGAATEPSTHDPCISSEKQNSHEEKLTDLNKYSNTVKVAQPRSDNINTQIKLALSSAIKGAV